MVWCELHNKLEKTIWKIYGYPTYYSPVTSVGLKNIIEDVFTICVFPVITTLLFIIGMVERKNIKIEIKFLSHRFYCSKNQESKD